MKGSGLVLSLAWDGMDQQSPLACWLSSSSRLIVAESEVRKRIFRKPGTAAFEETIHRLTEGIELGDGPVHWFIGARYSGNQVVADSWTHRRRRFGSVTLGIISTEDIVDFARDKLEIRDENELHRWVTAQHRNPNEAASGCWSTACAVLIPQMYEVACENGLGRNHADGAQNRKHVEWDIEYKENTSQSLVEELIALLGEGQLLDLFGRRFGKS